MYNKYVCFDTNAYRRFVTNPNNSSTLDKTTVFGNMDLLVKKERMHNVKACLSPIVAMELFSHLADCQDPDYENCKMSLGAAYSHCIDDNHKLRILLDAENQMSSVLFGIIPNDNDTNNQIDICRMTYEFFIDSSEQNMIVWKNNFELLREIIDSLESSFLNSLKDFVYNDIYKSRDKNYLSKYKEDIYNKLKDGTIETNTSYKQLERVLDKLGKNINELRLNEVEKLTGLIRKKFIVPIKFYNNLIKSILDSDGNYSIENSRNGNYFWDFNLLFAVGDFKINGIDMILISNDKKMLNAAMETGHRKK